MLWQTNTISPSHEHFLTVHIKQKILVHIERLQSTDPRPSTKTVVLFLPENETHDLGLLFINYEQKSNRLNNYVGEILGLYTCTEAGFIIFLMN